MNTEYKVPTIFLTLIELLLNQNNDIFYAWIPFHTHFPPFTPLFFVMLSRYSFEKINILFYSFKPSTSMYIYMYVYLSTNNVWAIPLESVYVFNMIKFRNLNLIFFFKFSPKIDAVYSYFFYSFFILITVPSGPNELQLGNYEWIEMIDIGLNMIFWILLR